MNCALSASAAVAMQTTTKSEAASTSAAAAAAAVSSSSSQKERKVSDATRRSLATTDFDVWKWTHEELIILLKEIYRDLGLIDVLHMDRGILQNFLLTVESSYRANPFHNFRHCFCVTQMMYVLLRGCPQLESSLDSADVTALVTACVCHDLDHPGLSNSYHKNARTEFWSRHADSSLERHHSERSLEILSRPQTDILRGVEDAAVAERIRSDMSSLILATDMARHGEYVADFERRVRRGFDLSSRQDLDSLKCVLVKACDISNECRPVDVSEAWADCLLTEYFTQGDRERLLGLPVLSHMDRHSTTKPEAQVGFIKFVLLPFFDSISKVLPNVKNFILPNLARSLSHYENMKKAAVEPMVKEEEKTNHASSQERRK